jgi:hypothetical protein
MSEILLGNVDAGALIETAQWVDLRFASAAAVRAAARQLDPLHRALAIAYFGETRVVEAENDDPQSVARAGLAALEQYSHSRFGRDFLQLSASEQADTGREISHSPEDTPLRRFYDLLRREAIRGYYTSRPGLTELDYQGNAYHIQCPGCEKK